jgi:hypothetical protein
MNWSSPWGMKGGKRKYYRQLFQEPEEEYYIEQDPLKAYNYWTFARGGYIEPFGKSVPFLHDKSENYTQGGMIRWDKGQFHPFKNDLDRDNKPVMLEIGSVVVPKPIIQLFYEYERIYGSVKQKQITDPSQLTQVIVMPQEAVVPAKHAEHFKQFLLDYGVTLPLPKEKYF